MQTQPDWLVPDWPAPSHVKAVFTTRAGGVSVPPYDTMNLGDHVGDEPDHVAVNRDRLAQALGVAPVVMQQVHGTHVARLPMRQAKDVCADAVLTTQPAQVATILVADCLPVLFADRAGRCVAAAHAGWRGLAGGVLGHTVEAFRDTSTKNSSDRAWRQSLNGLDATEIIAWLGPCIGPLAFEVGPEVHQAFVQTDPASGAYFKPQGNKFYADLAAIARAQLRGMGITGIYGNDSSPAWCTVGNPSRFFSHRRDRISGRMAACIWLT